MNFNGRRIRDKQSGREGTIVGEVRSSMHLSVKWDGVDGVDLVALEGSNLGHVTVEVTLDEAVRIP